MSSVPVEMIDDHAYVRIYYKRHWSLLYLPYAPKDSSEVNAANGSRPKTITEVIVIDPEDLPLAELKEICFKNNIPIRWAVALESGKKCAHECVYVQDRSRKSRTLTAKEAGILFKKLRVINDQSELIARILFFINGSMVQTGSCITLESLLRMKKEDVRHEEIAGVQNVCLQLVMPGKSCSSFVAHYLPKALLKRILILVQQKQGFPFVFSNSDGKPLQSKQVTDDIKAAGKEAGLGNNTTSLSLRPTFNVKRCKKIATRNALRDVPSDLLKPVSDVEFNAVCAIILNQQGKKGRTPKYRPIDMINAILYCSRAGKTLKRLPASYPPASAVESQYRRWNQSGIFHQLIKLLLAFRGLNSTQISKFCHFSV